MKVAIKKEKKKIDCGDLVYSEFFGEYGFVSIINNKYYFIDKSGFEGWSEPKENLNELIDDLGLELTAKNKDLIISLNEGMYI